MKTLLFSENFPPQTGGSGRWFWEIYSRLPRDQFMIATNYLGWWSTNSLVRRLASCTSIISIRSCFGRCFRKEYRR